MICGFPLLTARERHRDANAYDDGTLQVTYASLWKLVERAASAMLASGIRRGDRVAWSPENDIDTMVCLWSLFAIGAVACPINRRWTERQRRAAVDELQAIWLPRSAVEKLAHSPVPPTVSFGSLGESFNAAAPATVILTSGSTGSPKAVVHSLSAHMASALGAAKNLPLESGDRWLWSLPAYHVSGLSILVRCALAGATVFSGGSSAAKQLVVTSGVSHVSVVATQLRRLLQQDSFPPKSLRVVLVGGSAIPSPLIGEAQAMGVPVYTTYGLSEMASQVATSSSEGQEASAMRVLPHCRVKIDESSEILVQGDSLCLGYFRNGCIENVVDGRGWFHSGDLGCFDPAGALKVIGRIDNMFISGGENIHPESIERVLLDRPGVDQTIVVPRTDVEFGARPVAFVKMLPGFEMIERSGLREHLSPFELPDALLPWPDEADAGIKPNRARLTEIANSSRERLP